MKVILDNIIFSLQKMGGISVYWYELIKRMSTDKSFESTFYQLNITDCHAMAPKINKLNVQIKRESRLPLSITRYLPFRADIKKNTIFHSSYYRFARRAKNIVTIHDFTYEYYRKGPAKWVHSWQKKNALMHAAGVICISESTKKDLLSFFPDLKAQVKVIYNGKSDLFYVLPQCYEYSEQYKKLKNIRFVLFVGTRSGYKNFLPLVECLSLFHDIHLVVVGSDLDSQEITFLNNKIKGRYISMGFVDDVQLNELYNLAFCLIYPSEYEGFGIPVCEAMAAGCPVIAMNKSSIPEVAGNAGLLYTKLSSSVLKGYFTVLENPDERAQIIDLGVKQARKFSWDKCYKETVEFYTEIVSL